MSQLEDLLQQCTVKLSIPGQLGWGTGFFVAPGWILTCAHVVQRSPEQVQVGWQGITLEAVVERSWPDPYDLALLRVAFSVDCNPPCVYLDGDVQSRDPLYLFGYPDEGDRQGEPRTFNCDGITGGEIPAILFNLGQVRPGMSGAPLLNQRTGKVCGMVKFTRDRSSDLGGGAILTREILNQLPELRKLQREFHAKDRRWVINPQTGIEFQRYREAVICHYSQQRHLYTPTDALLPLEARSVERQTQNDGQERPVEKTVEQFPVLVGLRKYALGEQRQHVLLAGRPGSGKSTTLRQLVVTLAEEGQVPVLVQLKGDRAVPELIQAEFRRMKQRVTAEQVDEWLLNERLVLLLDGINEIPTDELRRSLAQFREDNLAVPMIFTTRDLSLGGFGKRLEMKPLSEPQMREFVGKYLPEQGKQLLDQLRDRLREIAETPLLLKMLCDVFDPETNQIPKNRGELFRWFDRDYKRIKKEIEYVPVSENFWEFKSEILQYLAFYMIQGKVQTADLQPPLEPWLTIPKSRAAGILETWLHQRGVLDAPTKAKLWLKDLYNYHLLQDAAKPEEIEFHHQLFQEYYVAEYLLQRLPTLTDEQLKQDYLNYLKWTEPVALMLALNDNEAQALRVVKLALDVDLMLGARLAGKLKSAFQAQSMRLISAQNVPQWFKYRLFARTQTDDAVDKLIEAFSDADWFVRKNIVEALGQIGTEKAVSALLGCLEDKDEEVISETSVWLRKLACKSIAPTLIKMLDKLDDYAQEKADSVIRYLLNTTDVVKDLESLVQNDATIRDYIEKYHRLNKWFRSPQIRIIGVEEIATSSRIFTAKEEFSIEEISKLVNSVQESESQELLLQDPDWYVREQFLEKLHYQFAHEKLETSINSSNQKVRENSVQFIELVVDLISKVSKDFDWRVREKGILFAEEVIRCIKNSQDIPELSTRIKKVLGNFNSILLNLSQDPNEDVRAKVVRTLGTIGDRDAITTLREALQDSSSDVRTYAAVTLGNIRDEESIQPLLERLKDESPDVKEAAANALEEISQKTSSVVGHLPYLIDLIIEDPEKYLQRLVSTIQSHWKFYNYEIFQAHLAAQNGEPSQNPGSHPITYNIGQVGNLNTGNVTIHGDQLGESHR